MAVYAEFSFYTDTYLGNAITEADFPRLALRASMVIDRLTFQRTAAVIEADTESDLINAIQMATCAVAEEIQKNENREAGETGVIASEKQGQYTVTYVEADDARQTADARIRKAARLYLAHTPLMFAGFNEDERSSYDL